MQPDVTTGPPTNQGMLLPGSKMAVAGSTRPDAGRELERGKTYVVWDVDDETASQMARAAHCTIVVASKGQTLEEANEAYAKHYAIAELEKFVSVIDRKTEFYDGAQGYWTGYLDGLADIKREYLETIDRLRGEEAS